MLGRFDPGTTLEQRKSMQSNRLERIAQRQKKHSMEDVLWTGSIIMLCLLNATLLFSL